MTKTARLSMGWFCPTFGDTSAFADPAQSIPQSLEHFERVSLAAEAAGFDYMLVPVSPCVLGRVGHGFVHARRTKRLKALVAIKPGFFHPVAQAKMVSTMDQLSQWPRIPEPDRRPQREGRGGRGSVRLEGRCATSNSKRKFAS